MIPGNGSLRKTCSIAPADQASARRHPAGLVTPGQLCPDLPGGYLIADSSSRRWLPELGGQGGLGGVGVVEADDQAGVLGAVEGDFQSAGLAAVYGGEQQLAHGPVEKDPYANRPG